MSDIHYKVGRHLSDRVPPGQSNAYYEGMLSRLDDKTRPGHTWVDDKRVRNGGYWRKLAKGAHAAEPSKRSKSTLKLAVGAAVGAAAAVGAVRFVQNTQREVKNKAGELRSKVEQGIQVAAKTNIAIATGVGLSGAWLSHQSANRRIERIQKLANETAEARVQQTQEQLKQEYETRLQHDLQQRTAQIQTDADHATERRVAETELELRRQYEQDLDRRTLEIQESQSERMTQQIQQISQDLEATKQREIKQRTEAIHQEERSRADKEVSQARRELEDQYNKRLERRVERSRIEIREEEQRNARESLVRQLQEHTDQSYQDVIKQLGADTRQGLMTVRLAREKLDPYTDVAEQDRQVKGSVTRMMKGYEAEVMRELALGMRQRQSEIEQIGGNKTPRSQKELNSRETIRWQTTQQALLGLKRREGAMQDSLDELGQRAQQEYLEVMAKVRSQNYSEDAKQAFEAEAKRINRRLNRRVQEALKSVVSDIGLE